MIEGGVGVVGQNVHGTRRTEDRRRLDRRKEFRRQPERRKNWPGSVNYDYGAESRAGGRRLDGSEKRLQNFDRRVSGNRLQSRRQGTEDRRQDQRRVAQRRSGDVHYTKSLFKEGAVSVSSHGKRPPEDRVSSMTPGRRLPPNTAAAVAVGPKASPYRSKPTTPAAIPLPVKKHPDDNFKPYGERLENLMRKVFKRKPSHNGNTQEER